MSGEDYPGKTAALGVERGRIMLPPWTWAILVSALAWLVIFIAIPPAQQNFPLGDDWAFAHGAIWFAHGQGIHYSCWASMPQLGQWLWSYPFLFTTGLAHVALRASVLVLSWLGLAAFYGLLRQGKVSPRLAALAAGTLALNPLFFASQGTYMTDVPALSFGLMALAGYTRALDEKSVAWVLTAMLAAVLAVTTRQTMIAVPVVAGWLLWRQHELRWKPVWLLAVITPILVCMYTSWWFARRTDVMPMQPVFKPWEMLHCPFLALYMCGLAVLPLCLVAPLATDRRLLGLCLIPVLAGAVLFFYQHNAFFYEGLFPYCGGMLSPWGTYSDGLVMGDRDVLLTPAWRKLFTILGCFGAARLLAALVESFRARTFPGILLGFTLLQFFTLLALTRVMDRYLEVLFPGAIFLVATRCSPSGAGWLRGAAATGLCGVLSVALFHDWLSWNSARWDLGRQMLAKTAVHPADIEGGFEWNGWYAYSEPGSPHPVASIGQTDASLKLWFTEAYFPNVTGLYALSFTPLTNAVVVASQPYTRWLPPATKTFLLVQQVP